MKTEPSSTDTITLETLPADDRGNYCGKMWTWTWRLHHENDDMNMTTGPTAAVMSRKTGSKEAEPLKVVGEKLVTPVRVTMDADPLASGISKRSVSVISNALLCFAAGFTSTLPAGPRISVPGGSQISERGFNEVDSKHRNTNTKAERNCCRRNFPQGWQNV